MNSFASPDQAVPFIYPEFQAPEKTHLDLTSLDAAAGGFKNFLRSQDEPKDDAKPVVQAALLQDFKEVLASSRP